jgi:arylsulfatase A-like enzyme
VIDGVDLLPYLAGKATGRPHQTLFWRSGQYKVVLDGDWKLQSSEAQGKVWLYDLAADPTERRRTLQRRAPANQAMLAMLKAQDAQSAKPAVAVAAAGAGLCGRAWRDRSTRRGDEFVMWDN